MLAALTLMPQNNVSAQDQDLGRKCGTRLAAYPV